MQPAPAAVGTREASDTGRWYVLFLMTAVYALNIADRYVLSTLIEPIKAEMGLSDAAVGFVTGVALAIFYVTAGIPLGVLADRVNRRNMVAAALASWSAMTALCGLAQNYWQLVLTRIGVGIGEAGGTPPSQSIVADRFAPSLRAMAMSIFTIGAAVGAALGTTGGGWLSDHFGWRMALIAFGFLGLPVALLVRYTMREPRRGQLDDHPAASEAVRFAATLRFIRSQKSLMHILAGLTVLTFWGWGTLWWTPAFLSRSHGMTPGEAGALLGPMHGIGGTVVMAATAWLAFRYGRADARRQAWFVALTTFAATVPSIVAFWTDSASVLTLMLWMFVPVTYLYIGPTSALVQNLVMPGMRGQTFAVLLFLANVANLVVAPELIGVASDFLASRLDDPGESLRYALVVSAFTGFWAAWHYAAATRALPGDLARAGSYQPGSDS